MFEPMHMVVGATIDKAAGGGKWKKILLVAPLAFATHPLLDYFNYGPHTLFHGPMNSTLKGTVIGIGLVLVVILIVTARRYWVGMLFAVLPDLEWVLFGITGWDSSQGLHHKLFWPPWLATEGGLLVQLGLFLLIACVVLLPLRKPSWRPAFGNIRARITFGRGSPERVTDLGKASVPASSSVWQRINTLPVDMQTAQVLAAEQPAGSIAGTDRASKTMGMRSGNKG